MATGDHDYPPQTSAVNPPKCPYCGLSGLTHPGVCPMVKALEYHENGSIKRVEFHPPQPLNLTNFPFGYPSSGQITFPPPPPGTWQINTVATYDPQAEDDSSGC